MATGFDGEGKVIKDAWRQVMLLLESKTSMSSLEKVRLLMIFFLTQSKLDDAERRRLLDQANLEPGDYDALTRLMHICNVTMGSIAAFRNEFRIRPLCRRI